MNMTTGRRDRYTGELLEGSYEAGSMPIHRNGREQVVEKPLLWTVSLVRIDMGTGFAMALIKLRRADDEKQDTAMGETTQQAICCAIGRIFGKDQQPRLLDCSMVTRPTGLCYVVATVDINGRKYDGRGEDKEFHVALTMAIVNAMNASVV